jgi:indole-3-glycerol phosphate synthase
MATILEKIIARKKQEVAERILRVPVTALENSDFFHRTCFSFSAALRQPGASGVIAEFKRRSPSKGIINGGATVGQVTQGYVNAGASALSILTDEPFFGGSNEDLTLARRLNGCPILRKDFTVGEYQVLEAKSIGADAILLIASVLSPAEVKRLAAFARSLGMEVLLEIHDETELGHCCENINAVGVNNRNLADFTVDVQRSFELADRIPNDFAKVSESGLSDPATVVALRAAGFNGFLIGENFMKQSQPEAACEEFIVRLSMS